MLTSLSLTSGIFAFSNKAILGLLLNNLALFPYTKVSKLVKNGVIVSDNPMDYLLLYRNASEVYSDRVHACIPTLAFGNIARLFSNSPRIALFENAKIPDVRKRLMIRINNILFFKNIFQFFFYPIMLRFFNIQYYIRC